MRLKCLRKVYICVIVCVVLKLMVFILVDFFMMPVYDMCHELKQTATPKYLHYVFLKFKPDSHMTEAYLQNQQQCMQMNPDYKVKFWIDQTLETFFKDHYEWFLPTWKNYPPVSQNDAARYFLLYHFGGVYLDLDITCMVPFDKIQSSVAENAEVILASGVSLAWVIPGGLSTAIIFSPPKHPFLHELISNLQIARQNYILPSFTIFLLAGPGYITKVYIKYPCKDQIHLLKPEFAHMNGKFLQHRFSQAWYTLDMYLMSTVRTYYKICLFILGIIVLAIYKVRHTSRS